jgi:hypothetical protein
MKIAIWICLILILSYNLVYDLVLKTAIWVYPILILIYNIVYDLVLKLRSLHESNPFLGCFDDHRCILWIIFHKEHVVLMFYLLHLLLKINHMRVELRVLFSMVMNFFTSFQILHTSLLLKKNTFLLVTSEMKFLKKRLILKWLFTI